MPTTAPAESEPTRQAKPLRHDGACSAVRGRCWRSACVERFGERSTIEYQGALVLAHCHGGRYRIADLDTRVELWSHAGAEAPE